ncbi:MAG: ATP-binding protein, partial [Dehalococcoidia bacterium]
MELLERTSFLDELSRLFTAAAAGHGALVFVGGEAGAGKTALTREFCRSQAAGARVLVGACDALSTPRPLGPLVDIARASGGGLAGLLDGGAPRERVFAALLTELSTRNKPTIAVFEDVHWADDATLDLLRFLGRRLDGTRSVLLATYRDDEVGPRHPLRIALGDLATAAGVRRMKLPPLSEAAVRTLAAGSELDPAVLHRQTGGNPFFVTEALSAGGSGIPATVRDALLARVARLSAEGRAALEAAAVAGSRAEAWLVAEVLGSHADALEECLAAGLLGAAEDLLTFRHELLHEVVLAAMSALCRTALHRSVLTALRSHVTAPALATRLAHHAEAAGDCQAVLEYAPVAAQQAAGLKAHREAVAQYTRALRCADGLQPAQRAELLESLAYQRFLTDRHAEAVDAWTHAL